MATSQMRMKLLIDTRSNKIVFAEAGKECVDFLLCILSLPVATLISLVKLLEQGMKGSLVNLYRSIENLEEVYIKSGQSKNKLLEPSVPLICSASWLPLLSLNDDGTGHLCIQCGTQLSFIHSGHSPICRTCSLMHSFSMAQTQLLRESGFVECGTYMIMDDLEVKPMSISSISTLLEKFSLKNLNELKEQVVNLTETEAVMLLKSSLETDSVLTDVFLNNKFVVTN